MMNVYRMGKVEKLADAIAENPQFLDEAKLAMNAARILYPIAREAQKRGTCAPEVAEWLLKLDERVGDLLDRLQ